MDIVRMQPKPPPPPMNDEIIVGIQGFVKICDGLFLKLEHLVSVSFNDNMNYIEILYNTGTLVRHNILDNHYHDAKAKLTKYFL